MTGEYIVYNEFNDLPQRSESFATTFRVAENFCERFPKVAPPPSLRRDKPLPSATLGFGTLLIGNQILNLTLSKLVILFRSVLPTK
jgi:hypothetical protein